MLDFCLSVYIFMCTCVCSFIDKKEIGRAHAERKKGKKIDRTHPAIKKE